MFEGCGTIDRYEKLNTIGEGAYGCVYKARDKESGEIVALKKMHVSVPCHTGFPITTLREIRLLASMRHPNIVNFKHVAVEHTYQRSKKTSQTFGRSEKRGERRSRTSADTFSEASGGGSLGTSDKNGERQQEISPHEGYSHKNVHGGGRKAALITYLVFEYCEHDLASLLDKMYKPFVRAEIKCILQALLQGLDALHENNIMHRDIKLPNLFLTKEGDLKIGDFGLARDFMSPNGALTGDVVTMWYRAPELLLGLEEYTTAIDIWAVGCVMGELLLGEPFLPGTDEANQMKLICNLMGRPTSRIWPGVEELPHFSKFNFPDNPVESPQYNNLPLRFPTESATCVDLLGRLLICDPFKRITAREALCHPYFKESPLPKKPSVMPSWKEFCKGAEDHGQKTKGQHLRGQPNATKAHLNKMSSSSGLGRHRTIYRPS